ncbi:protein FAM200A-like [Metopolophium dirhodum]|uniref:protein FAM200A-like n=1 Tax=Metopolophium dirhodum TaxID=44670 RepID=UPI00298F6971|nr:protein FAM200A-like [Metopolophium dirhodum]
MRMRRPQSNFTIPTAAVAQLKSPTLTRVGALLHGVEPDENGLQINFNARFEDFPEESLGWIRSPHHFNINEIKLGNLKIIEELIDLSSDENLRIRFQENACGTFWISIKSEYPELSKQAISILLPFASTYLCETAFSTPTIIKNKYRSRLNVEADLRVAVSNIKPNLESIMSTMQAQVSH